MVSEVKGAVGDSGTILAGTSSYNTAESIELSKEAEQAGADALLLVVPYYNKPPQEGTLPALQGNSRSGGLPCVLYNVTSRTSLNMSHETTIHLSEIDNIVGVKEAAATWTRLPASSRGPNRAS